MQWVKNILLMMELSRLMTLILTVFFKFSSSSLIIKVLIEGLPLTEHDSNMCLIGLKWFLHACQCNNLHATGVMMIPILNVHQLHYYTNGFA